jgi:hypothetical protein
LNPAPRGIARCRHWSSFLTRARAKELFSLEKERERERERVRDAEQSDSTADPRGLFGVERYDANVTEVRKMNREIAEKFNNAKNGANTRARTRDRVSAGIEYYITERGINRVTRSRRRTRAIKSHQIADGLFRRKRRRAENR